MQRDEKSAAETCRAKGWKVGTVLVGDEGCGRDAIEITAIGREQILAVCVARDFPPNGVCRPDAVGWRRIPDRGEYTWTLDLRAWRPATADELAAIQEAPEDG